jgi:hypothetical protein
MRDVDVLLDRLSRRGVLTITAEDGSFDVTFKAHGPWIGGRCTTDKHDLFDHLRLGAKNWQGDGPDFAAQLVLCEMETRPDNHEIDDLAWKIERRRDSRTHGPPLPSYIGWYRGGWRPGDERWLRTSDHKYEYIVGYLRQVETARKDQIERHQAEVRRRVAERRRVKKVLNG